MKSPVSPRGATDEPYGSQRRAGNPAHPAQMTAGQGIRGANHGSQCPLTPPGLAATARGESAGGGFPPDFLRPVQTPDSCLGVKGSRAQLQSLPSFTQAFFAQAFTFDFIPRTLPSLFGPVGRGRPRRVRAGLCRWCPSVPPAWPAVRGAGRGRSRSSAASAAAVTGSSIRQADAGDALKLPVRDPDRRQRPGLRPRVPPCPIHCRGDLAAGAVPVGRGPPSTPATQSGPTRQGRTAPAGRPSPGNR